LQSVVRPARVDDANEAEELAKREAREREADRNAGGDEKKFREYGHGVRGSSLPTTRAEAIHTPYATQHAAIADACLSG
jgi:hypothetical protein